MVISRKQKRSKTTLQNEFAPEKMAKLSTWEQLKLLREQVFTSPEFKLTKQLLSGKAALDPSQKISLTSLGINDFVDVENRLSSVDRGLLMISKLASDWDFNLLELKKLIQIVKEALPRGIGKKEVKSKQLFESIHRRLSQRSRAANWIEIHHASWTIINEFPELENSGRSVMNTIVDNLKNRPDKEGTKNGFNWKNQMKNRLKKWDETKELY